MNRERRHKLLVICARLEELAAELGEVRNEEQDAFDNLPESFQDGDRGIAMQDAIDALDGAFDDVTNAVDQIGEAGTEA